MTKAVLSIDRQEINALIEDVWRAQEHLTAAQRSLEALESRIAAMVPDEE